MTPLRLARRGSLSTARGGTPTTYTIYGNAADGYVFGNPSPLSVDTADSAIYVGQRASGNSRYEGFLSFDTSGVVGTITAVTLSLYGNWDGSVTDFTLEARVHDWGATLATDDWVDPANLGSKTLVASVSSVGWNAAGYNTLASQAAFLTNINQSGATRLLLNSSRHRLGNSPSGDEYIGFQSADTAGTTQDPRLVIEALV